MNEQTPRQELASLRGLLSALESGKARQGENGRDVTAREIEKLRADIAALEHRIGPDA